MPRPGPVTLLDRPPLRVAAAARPPWVLVALAFFPVALLGVPLASLAWRTMDLGLWRAALADPVVTDALALSMRTTLVALFLVVTVGTPVAYLLARYQFPGRESMDTLMSMPMVL